MSNLHPIRRELFYEYRETWKIKLIRLSGFIVGLLLHGSRSSGIVFTRGGQVGLMDNY